MTTARLQRDRRSGSYVYVAGKDRPWGHGPRWSLPIGVPPKHAEAAQRDYTTRLQRYRLSLRHELANDPDLREAFDQLRGRRLACPCPLEVRCPTDILLALLEETSPSTFRAETP